MPLDFYFAQSIGPFKVQRKLGQGRYGLVKLGVSESDGKQVAIKIVQKAQLAEEERDCIKTEVEVMSYIKHINVIRLHKVIENRLSICMFLEFAAGGELFEHIIRQTKLSEAEARKFFVQLLDGLGYCHERMIVHRDIKAENGVYVNVTF